MNAFSVRGLLAAVLAWAGLGIVTTSAQAAPVATHPRLWVTQADLPRLRAWAVPSNPMYKSGLLASANQAKGYADSAWNWTTGQPSAAWHEHKLVRYRWNAAKDRYLIETKR